AIFIIKSGEVALFKSNKPLARLKEGDFFGEMALLEEVPRTATATAVTVAEIGFMYKAAFDTLIENDPRLGLKVIYNLAKMVSGRLRETSEQYVKTI
ncbi:MAG: cyclic nucleotide-binding domain-containing protein, partial [Elusimicrobiota bacterium]